MSGGSKIIMRNAHCASSEAEKFGTREHNLVGLKPQPTSTTAALVPHQGTALNRAVSQPSINNPPVRPHALAGGRIPHQIQPTAGNCVYFRRRGVYLSDHRQPPTYTRKEYQHITSHMPVVYLLAFV